MILVNFKIYKESFGDEAIKLARICKETADEFGIRIVAAAAALDAVRIKKETGAEVWLQNVDQYNEGKYSGWVSSQQAMALGIKGSLLNHSEHKTKRGTIYKILANSPPGFEIMVCEGSIGQLGNWTNKRKPDWFLYEPPELIASKDKSVSSEKPEAIKNAVEACGGTALIVGAGIKTKEDVKIALKLGAKGVGLSSAFVLADNPKAVLSDLAQGFGGNSCYNLNNYGLN